MARILILSSDVVRTELVRAVLMGLQAEVRVAEDLAAFYRLTEQLVYDVVLVVGVWPFCCGAEVLRRVRPRPLRRPEVYLLSWHQAEQTVLGMLECGVDQYMTFPLNPGRLRAKVIGVLER